MVSLTIRPIAGGNFAVDDGTELMTHCPCCGQAFDHYAATAFIQKIEAGELTMDAARALAELMEKASSR